MKWTKIKVVVYESDSIDKIIKKVAKEYKKLHPPASPDWQDELHIELKNYTHEHFQGKVFITHANFIVCKLNEELN